MENIRIEKMKYRNDSISYGLCLLGILANVVYFCIFYKNNSGFFYDYMMGLSVIYNLLFMLGAFMSAEYIKHYHYGFSIVLLVLGLLQIVRMFVYPLNALNDGAITSSVYTNIVIWLAISASLSILSAVISFIKSITIKLYTDKQNKQ